MGLRFRKSISILPGLRLNVSKRGASVSVGGKGLTVNVGKHGVRTTAGLPGSGVSYSTYRPYENDNTPPAAKAKPVLRVWMLWVLVLIAAVVYYARLSFFA